MSEAEALPSGATFSFGRFHLIATRRLLLENDQPVRVGSRALEILLALVERAGEIVSREELVRRVWPNTFVEEGNLRVHIAALRKILGDGHASNRYVATIPGRGYRFVAPVAAVEAPAQPQAGNCVAAPASNLPAPLARMVGRTEVVQNLLAQLSRRRFITITGPGGIGKTAVALAVANASVASFRDGIWFVDLAPVSDRALVASALASVLNIGVVTEQPFRGLLAHLLDKDMLLVLDNCEHVVDTAAALAEAIFKGAPRVHILATSREPLLAEGEAVVRLASLGFPAGAGDITAAEGMTYPALQLFVERAAACIDDFELTDADAPAVSEICRRLDGIPLAIELAAGRLDALGVRGLADHLNDRFRLLTRGRRTALQRHQTMRATLDCSYELLSGEQRRIFRRLGVFAGWFTSEAGAFVVSGNDSSASEAINAIADLVARSLVVADVEGPVAYYRLLETTRAYAVERLVEAGEAEPVVRLHAECYRRVFESAEAEWEARPIKDWVAAYARQIDDVRAALDWAFSPQGDAAVGIALTVAAVPLWCQLSLINECRERVERALSALGAGGLENDSLAMKLQAALGWSLMCTVGPARASGAAWATAYKLAERLGEADYRLRGLWGLWAGRMNNGELTLARELAEQFCRLALQSAEPSDRHIGDRMLGASLHLLGDQVAAREHVERMLARYVPSPHRSDVIRYQFDQPITAKITLARVLWLQGLADQALHAVDSSIAEALSLGNTLTLCNTLAQGACPVALLLGDLERAERFTTMLLQQTERYRLDIWHLYAVCYRGQLRIRRGDFETGLSIVRPAVEQLRAGQFVQYHTTFLMALAEGFAGAGQTAEALRAIDEALARSEQSGERWCTPEMLRMKGEAVLRLGGVQGPEVAEHHFVASLELARQQQALAWELRTATSLARLRCSQDRAAEAHDLLASVLERFTEGFDTPDLRAAKLLLDDIS